MDNKAIKSAIEVLIKERIDLLNKYGILNEIDNIEKGIDSLTSLNSLKTLTTPVASLISTKDAATRLNSAPTTKPNGYKPSLSLSHKFALLLNHNGRFLHFREAAEMINYLDATNNEVGKLASKLSSSCTSLKKEHLVKYKIGKNNINTFWGRTEWMDDNGEIKSGYEFNESAVNIKNTGAMDLFGDNK